MKGRSTFWRTSLVATVLLFAGLAFALANVKAPWCDEAWFANPSYNLAFHGKMSTNVLEPSGHYLKAYLSGIQERTYIVVPNHMVALAGWYKLVGFSLVKMRAFSILWGVLGLGVLFYVCHRLFPEPLVAQLGTFFTAIDFIYLWSCADGRMEAPAHTLALGSIAAYLYLRERNLTRAVWVSQLLSAAAVFTHPNAALVQAALWVVVWRFDRSLVRWRHLVIAAVPYICFALAWGVYIWEAPGDFKAQFFANAAGRNSARFSVVAQPWMAVWLELIRHAGVYVANGLWSASMNNALLLMPVLHVISMVAFFRGRRSYDYHLQTFLWCTVAMMLTTTFLNGFKAPMYMIYVLPLYNAIFAFGLIRLWQRGQAHLRLIAVSGGVIFVGLQLTTAVDHLRADEYHRYYEPAIAQLQQYQAEGKSIVGTSALGFGLGFQGFEDDWRLGLHTGRRPDVVVLDRSYRNFMHKFELEEPDVFAHNLKTLNAHYRFARRFGTLWIFERTRSSPSPSAVDSGQVGMQEKGKQAVYLFKQLEHYAEHTGVDAIKEPTKHAALRF